jgi:hypothetical protein
MKPARIILADEHTILLEALSQPGPAGWIMPLI